MNRWRRAWRAFMAEWNRQPPKPAPELTALEHARRLDSRILGAIALDHAISIRKGHDVEHKTELLAIIRQVLSEREQENTSHATR